MSEVKLTKKDGRRVFYVDVGNMSEKEAEAKLKKVKAQFEERAK